MESEKNKKSYELLIIVSSPANVEFPSTCSALGNSSVQNPKFGDKQETSNVNPDKGNSR